MTRETSSVVSERDEPVDLDASFDRIDRLFAQLPFLRCPGCGNFDENGFDLIYDSTTRIKAQANAFRKVMVVDSTPSSTSEYDFRNSRLRCEQCHREFPLPDDWSWE